jgi:Flp pilus assembly pilin Flp
MMVRRFHRDESGQEVVEYRLAIALLTPASVSSMKPRALPDLVIGACILIALAFIAFWLFDRQG